MELEKMATEERISLLWIVVMVNMIFADIYTFMFSNVMGDPIDVTQAVILVFAIINEIPIMMIFLSRVLKPATNRWVNMVACGVTALFVVAGGSLTVYYVFFAAMEIGAMLLIVKNAVVWGRAGEVER